MDQTKQTQLYDKFSLESYPILWFLNENNQKWTKFNQWNELNSINKIRFGRDFSADSFDGSNSVGPVNGYGVSRISESNLAFSFLIIISTSLSELPDKIVKTV